MPPRASSCRDATRSWRVGRSRWCCSAREIGGASFTITHRQIPSDRPAVRPSDRRACTAAPRRLQQAPATEGFGHRARGRDAHRRCGWRAEAGRAHHHPQRPHRRDRPRQRNPDSQERRAYQSRGEDRDAGADRRARARGTVGRGTLCRLGGDDRTGSARRQRHGARAQKCTEPGISRGAAHVQRGRDDRRCATDLPQRHRDRDPRAGAPRRGPACGGRSRLSQDLYEGHAGAAAAAARRGREAAATGDPSYATAHNSFLAGWTAEEKGWAGLDSGAVARTARSLAQTKVTIVPTLVVHDMLVRLDNPILLARPGMEDVPDNAESVRSVPSLLRRTGWRAGDFDAFRRSRWRQDQFVREYKRAGGAIAAGSDAANQLLIPGYSLHEEMSLLVAAGLTPLE